MSNTGFDNHSSSKLRHAMDALFLSGRRLVTAESLTNGGIGAKIVEMPRVSSSIVGVFGVYNDDMKVNMLGVPRNVIEKFSAVSAEVAHYMARGAIENTFPCGDTSADIAIAVTGYAGSPNGFAPESEAGKVYIALGTCFNEKSRAGINVQIHEHRFEGSRIEVQQATIAQSIEYLHQVACQARMVPQGCNVFQKPKLKLVATA
jgi:PncC family amidohydrolase